MGDDAKMRCQYCTEENNSDTDDQQPAQRILGDHDKYNCPMLSDDDDPYAAAREEGAGAIGGVIMDAGAIASTSFNHLPSSLPKSIMTKTTTTKSLLSLSPCTETTEKSSAADGSSGIVVVAGGGADEDHNHIRLPPPPVINVETDERPLVEF